MYFAGHKQQDAFLSAYICNTQVCYTGWFKVTLQKNWFAKTVDKKNSEASRRVENEQALANNNNSSVYALWYADSAKSMKNLKVQLRKTSKNTYHLRDQFHIT